MKLFNRDKAEPISVPPELQQYYQVPTQPTAKRHLPVVLILVAVILIALLVGGGVWLAVKGTNMDSVKTKSSQSTQPQKKNPPVAKPKTDPNLNTQPIDQPSVK
jgi:flagellar basal body-associated protein FliL